METSLPRTRTSGSGRWGTGGRRGSVGGRSARLAKHGAASSPTSVAGRCVQITRRPSPNGNIRRGSRSHWSLRPDGAVPPAVAVGAQHSLGGPGFAGLIAPPPVPSPAPLAARGAHHEQACERRPATQRRGWDLNPRWTVSPQLLSREPHSAALAPLLGGGLPLRPASVPGNTPGFHRRRPRRRGRGLSRWAPAPDRGSRCGRSRTDRPSPWPRRSGPTAGSAGEASRGSGSGACPSAADRRSRP